MNIFIEWDCFLVCGQNTFLTFFRIFIHELFPNTGRLLKRKRKWAQIGSKEKGFQCARSFLVVMKN